MQRTGRGGSHLAENRVFGLFSGALWVAIPRPVLLTDHHSQWFRRKPNPRIVSAIGQESIFSTTLGTGQFGREEPQRQGCFRALTSLGKNRWKCLEIRIGHCP